VAGQIKAVIFDMGGVFLRTDSPEPREALAKNYGLTRTQLEELVFETESAALATVGKISQEEHWENIYTSLSIPGEKRQWFRDEFWRGDTLDADLVGFLGTLRPEFRTGLLSNAWTGTREMLLEKYHCPEVFDVKVFSYEVHMAKPDPIIYRHILSVMQVEPEETIFLDDNKGNIASACDMGIHGIRFLNHQQAIEDIRAFI
jgi:putative hydrolase of the HAD superfamily